MSAYDMTGTSVVCWHRGPRFGVARTLSAVQGPAPERRRICRERRLLLQAQRLPRRPTRRPSPDSVAAGSSRSVVGPPTSAAAPAVSRWHEVRGMHDTERVANDRFGHLRSMERWVDQGHFHGSDGVSRCLEPSAWLEGTSRSAVEMAHERAGPEVSCRLGHGAPVA